MSSTYTTQNELLLQNLMDYYNTTGLLDKMLSIISGESSISLRIVDWFATNYSKKYWTQYLNGCVRFKVYLDYKLKLKAYSKRALIRFVDGKESLFPIKEIHLLKQP